ncbi:Der1-like family-domain-containing protein [Sphaerosporella brunnea]|uniref:Derlin n=1 Tax=Sphaerosporella brunnea TaxID=1250544 RepID=A0A5J5EXD8_9PEZI|nr:Der1-like family-domain-containing protein [Sphaerosporella brunnea]
MADIGQIIRDAPPVARTLAGATLLISFSSFVLGLVNPMYFIYIPHMVWNPARLQLWRLVTSFLLSSPKLGVLMDPFFLFKYASDCEHVRLRRKGDFMVFLLFVGSIIVLLNTFLIGGMTFCSPLILSLAYYWAAFESPSTRVNFFIATFPVKFLPWIMLLMTLVQGGNVFLDLTGIVAAHAYLFLTEIWPRFGGGRDLLRPLGDTVEGWFEGYERAARPQQPQRVQAQAGVRVGGAEGATGSSLFGQRSQVWAHRGQGHRLGS